MLTIEEKMTRIKQVKQLFFLLQHPNVISCCDYCAHYETHVLSYPCDECNCVAWGDRKKRKVSHWRWNETNYEAKV
jgi:hypothetical protein